MRPILLLIFSLFISCSVHVAGGPGGQTTNGVVGGVYQVSEFPVANAQVSLHRSDFAPGEAIIVDSQMRVDGGLQLSQADGTFEFEGIIPERYLLECLWGDSLGLIDTFTISDDNEKLNRGDLTLLKTGSVQGVIDSLFISLYDSVSIHIAGLSRFVQVEADNSFEIRGLAPWDYSLIITGYSDDVAVESKEKVLVKSGGVLNLGELGEGINPEQYAMVRVFLDSSGLEDIPVREVVTLAWEDITGLNLQNRGLKKIHPTVKNLLFLKHLRLDSNSIAIIPPEIGAHTTLLTLTLSLNDLTTLPLELSSCTSLTYLDLSRNSLTTTENRLYTLSNMRTLFLNENYITEFPMAVLNMKLLASLDCRDNSISLIPESLIDNFVNLLNVDFGMNFIDTSVLSPELIQWVSDRSGDAKWIATQR